MKTTHKRELQSLISGIPTSDGVGVKLTRLIGSPELNILDPFLLFDVFESDQKSDYIGGFPDHPHRGFETVTYLLAGRMRHKDSAGHEGVIEPGGVQWMTAGKGIVHSEMPEQEDGLLQGFQLWINLPAKDKMKTPAYQEFTPNDIAVEQLDMGTVVRVIAGVTNNGTTGQIVNHTLNPVFLDVYLLEGQSFHQRVDSESNVFIYVIDGIVLVGEREIKNRHLGVLRNGDNVVVSAPGRARFLLLAAQPLNEPIARGGPFVMNTKEEVLQAYDDFKHKRF